MLARSVIYQVFLPPWNTSAYFIKRTNVNAALSAHKHKHIFLFGRIQSCSTGDQAYSDPSPLVIVLCSGHRKLGSVETCGQTRRRNLWKCSSSLATAAAVNFGALARDQLGNQLLHLLHFESRLPGPNAIPTTYQTFFALPNRCLFTRKPKVIFWSEARFDKL